MLAVFVFLWLIVLVAGASLVLLVTLVRSRRSRLGLAGYAAPPASAPGGASPTRVAPGHHPAHRSLPSEGMRSEASERPDLSASTTGGRADEAHSQSKRPPYAPLLQARAYAMNGDKESFDAVAEHLDYHSVQRLRPVLREAMEERRQAELRGDAQTDAHPATGGAPSGRNYGSYNSAEWQEAALRARSIRVHRAVGRDKLASALASLSADGFYVFTDLTTEAAGSVDFLAVGPTGIHYGILMSHEGFVGRREDGSLFWGQESVPKEDDPEEDIWYGGPFEEDFDAVLQEVGEDVAAKIFGGEYGEMFYYLCFTEAVLQVADGEHPTGCISVWDLAYQVSLPLEPEREHHALDPGEVDRLAGALSRSYGRDPILVPSYPEDRA